MQTPNSPEVEVTYFLGTGPKEFYYTLWSKTLIRGSGLYYNYRQNLSHDRDEAIAKATEKTGQQSWEAFDISDYKRNNSGAPDLSLEPDQVIFTFGKYQGQSVAAVADSDIRYLFFLATKSDWEPRETKHARVLNYIKAFFKPVAEKAAADRAAARAERDATRADLPAFEGRVEITGTVVSVKLVDNQFGSTWKFLVEHESGWKVWGSIPQELQTINIRRVNQHGEWLTRDQQQPSRGDLVSFTAKVQKSPSDPKFGFFSRPTKAQLLKSTEGEITKTFTKEQYYEVTVVQQVEGAQAPAAVA
jgi:hypothetical protein